MSSLGARAGIMGGGFFKPLNPSPISSTVEGAGDSFPPTGNPQHNEREQRRGPLHRNGGVDPTDVPVWVSAYTQPAAQYHKRPGTGGMPSLFVSPPSLCTSASTFEPVMCSAVGSGPGGGYRQPRLRLGEVVEPFRATMVGPPPMVGTAVLDAGVRVPGSQEDNSPAGGLPKVQKILGGLGAFVVGHPQHPPMGMRLEVPPGEGVHGQENPVQETGENKPEGFTANGVSCHTQPFLVGTNVSHTNRVLNTPTDQAGGDRPLLLLSDGQECREPGDGVEIRDTLRVALGLAESGI